MITHIPRSFQQLVGIPSLSTLRIH